MLWYAVHVHSRHEKQVALVLREKQIATFLPLYRVERTWATSRRTIELPLFAGYVFCTFEPAERQAVISTHGVVRIVGIGHTPTPIDPEELEAIRVIADSGLPASPCEHLQSGDRVTIERGALAGTEGILIQVRNERRLVVSISLLKRSVAVTLDRDWIRPISPHRLQAWRCAAAAGGANSGVS